MKDILIAVGFALAVSCCAWGTERTVYLSGAIPEVLSRRFVEIPSDADSPVDWRKEPAPPLGDWPQVYADRRSTNNQ